jgi:hypothetical protein
MDDRNWLDDKYWSLAKMYVYKLQKEPFIHIDNDVFLWDEFPKELFENDFFFQEIELFNELGRDFYLRGLSVFKDALRGNIEFENDFTLAEIKDILHASAGVVLQDDIDNFVYPMPLTAHDKDDTFVGRIRRDETQANTLNCWVVSDNLRKGAATNAVQIAEELVKRFNLM